MEEVKYVLYSMGRAKALGPDGIPIEFLLHHWEIMTKDIFNTIVFFFRKQQMSKVLNHSYLTLIPKKVPELSWRIIDPSPSNLLQRT